MLRLLIVDDEKVTRDSLAKYVPWSSLRIGGVQTARNGTEALALAHREPPDILVTDVRMPKMDGLELAERFRELYPSCKILFLSGYADKEYLKKAINLRAVSYIEKPVDLDEVKEAVRAAVAACEQEVAVSEEAEFLRKSYRENIGLIRETAIKKALKGCETPQELEAARTDAIFCFEPGAVLTVAVVVLHWTPAATEAEKEVKRSLVLAACRELAWDRLAARFVGFVETDACALVLAKGVAGGLPGTRAVFSDLLERVDGFSGGILSVDVGIGVPAKDASELATSYATALTVNNLRFFREGERVFYPNPARAEKLSADSDLIGAFRDALLRNDMVQAETHIAELSSTARSQEPADIDSVRNVFFKLFLIVFEKAWNQPGPNPLLDEEKTYVWKEIQERPNLVSLTELIRRYVVESFGEEERNGSSSRKVLEAQRFMRKNFTDVALSVRAIAEQVGLSTTYLCTLYKKTTGKTISDYVGELRIEMAKELLRDVGIKTHDVATRVGYRDANYFSTVFRKSVGCTPTEYRERA